MVAISTENMASTDRNLEKQPEERLSITPRQKADYQERFEQVLRGVPEYLDNPNLDLIRKAYDFAHEAHITHFRRSGEPYITHCIETAYILTELRMDVESICSGLLHDVVEDAEVSVEEIRENFGDEIALLVDGVTKISELKFQSQAQKQAENFRKMIFSMAQDLRVIMIKFADRLHNMRTLEHLPEKKAMRIALETRDVYAPLAHRFGIARLKWELEDLSLKALDPEAYYDLAKKVAGRRVEREQYIEKVASPIRAELAKHKIQSEIKGRAKSLYSIYRKMQKRGKPFEEIYDLLAVRIVVQKVDECYFALGVVHTLFTPVHDRFKDYIATPKLNMYQSLHTTVIGPEGKMIEIQIRTEEMNRIAEIGIAAHWKYKEGKQKEDELDRYSAWLREMVDWQKDTMEPEEYLDILKTDLFLSEVFIFTPKGDLYKLPIGATPVDFAFAIHTDVGVHCIGAKVNGRIVPLNTQLKSGDSVEILTSANQRPHQDWLSFVQTSKAKSKIKRLLKEARQQDAMRLGEEILNKGLKRYNIKRTKDAMRDLLQQLEQDNLEQLFVDLGEGALPFQRIVEILAPEKLQTKSDDKKENLFERFVTKARGSAKGIRVQGMDQLLIRFAQCCHPVPGDAIVGFITQGRGIVVHRRDCVNALKLMETPEKIIDVAWDVDGAGSFMVQLRMVSEMRKDFLRDVTESLSADGTDIMRIDSKADNSLIHTHLIIEVKDLSHLRKIMRRLYNIRGVISVERDSGNENSLRDPSN